MYDIVIIPLEGAPHCERAVPPAHDEARRHGAPLMLLHVVPRPEGPAPDPRVRMSGPSITAGDWPAQGLTRELARATAYLEDVKLAHGLPKTTAIQTTVGEPVRRILAEIGRHRRPLLVMTTGEDTAGPRPMLSNVTQQVLAKGSAPVLAVHAPAQEKRSRTTGPVDSATIPDARMHHGARYLTSRA